MSSATQRTLELLRAQGWEAGVVERWLGVPGKGGQRADLFGLWDIVALNRHGDVIGVQCFTTAVTEHQEKMAGNPVLEQWLGRNQGILVGWRKLKVKRGGKAKVWLPRIWECRCGDVPYFTEWDNDTVNRWMNRVKIHRAAK